MQEYQCCQDVEKIFDALCRIPTLEIFDTEHLKHIIAKAKLQKFAPGEVIIREGEVDRTIFFLVHGNVAVSKGTTRINSLRRTGDVFGEMGVIDGNVRSATITAQAESLCLLINAEELYSIDPHNKLANQVVLYKIFSEILAARLRKMNDEIIYLRKELDRSRPPGKKT